MVGQTPRRCRRPTPCQGSQEVGLIRAIDVSGAARRDLLDESDYLSERSDYATDGFFADVDERYRDLAEHPFLGRVIDGTRRRLGSLRAIRVSGRFRNYLVFYRVYTRHIRIVRILHGARDLKALLRLPG